MDNKLFELFDAFKIVVYVPFSDFPDYLKQLETKDINRIDEYKNCMSWVEVTSVRTSLEGADSHIGGTGKRSMEKEVRLEFICDKANLRDIVRFMKLVHPYESPEIDILPIIQLDD